MLRSFAFSAAALIATPALAHTGDHGVLGFAEAFLHGLVDHGALIATVAVVGVGVAMVLRRRG
jgi:hypothetical protein